MTRTDRQKSWRRSLRWLILPPAVLAAIVLAGGALLVARDCRDFVLVIDSRAHPRALLAVAVVWDERSERTSVLWEGRLDRPGVARFPIKKTERDRAAWAAGLRVTVQEPDRAAVRRRDIVTTYLHGATHRVIVGPTDILYEESHFGSVRSLQGVPLDGWQAGLWIANGLVNFLSCIDASRDDAVDR